MSDAEKSREELLAELGALRAELAAARAHAADTATEEALRLSEERFRGLAEASFEGICIHENGRILEVNDVTCRLFGYEPGELIGMSVLALAAPESVEQVKAAVREGLQKPYESVGRRKDGTTFPGELYAKVIPYQGRIVRVVAMRDATEHKRIEQALRASEEQWRTLVESAPNSIVVADEQERIRFVNRLSGDHKPEDMYGMSIYDFVQPSDQERVRESLREAARTGRAVSYEALILEPGGAEVWYHNNVAALSRNGTVVGYLFIGTNISELKRNEERIKRNELFLSRAQEIARTGCWEATFGGPVETWSDELYRLYGVEPGAIEPTFENFLKLVHPDDRPALERRTSEVLARGDALMEEFRIVRPDGAVRVLYSKAEVIRDSVGHPIRMIGVNQDVTELKQAYEEIAQRTSELRKAQELDYLKSNFVNAVTHELRTPLTSIKGYAEFLEDEVGGPLSEPQREFVHQLQLGAERLERLVDDLLDFARIDAGTFKLRVSDADLTAKIRETALSLEPQAREARLSLKLALPEEPLRVAMDAQRIAQVLLNLVNNAIKFTPPGGTITVTAVSEGVGVRVEVTDTGIGIPAEERPKLFRRFSQLESGLRSGGGTGLGLNISKAIVEAHHGAIGVTSQPGVGSTFWFTLPSAPHDIVEEPMSATSDMA
jgi:PAS domain S-box-containing protein